MSISRKLKNGLFLNEYNGIVFKKDGQIIGHAKRIFGIFGNSFIYKELKTQKWMEYNN